MRLKKFLISYVIICSFVACTSTLAIADEAKFSPYFRSIKANEANVRTGPSVKYPITWVYKHKFWPVKIVASFDGWRKIEDIYGHAGWIHETLLTSKRHVVVKGQDVQEAYRLPVVTASITMMIEPQVVAQLLKCKGTWCNVQIGDIKGWVQASNLWGTDYTLSSDPS